MSIHTAIKYLYQGGYYRLIYPVRQDGQPVPSVSEAKFEMFDQRGQSVFESSATFDVDAQELEVILLSEQSAELIGRYRYELWVRDAEGEAMPVQTGQIVFIKTRTRF